MAKTVSNLAVTERENNIMKEYLDILYKQINGNDLYLDLFMPEDDETNPPLIMWIHGGAWIEGGRKSPFMLFWQVERGYALASIEYRLGEEGIFPANIIDCKDALIYLKSNAEKYGYNAEKIAVAGDSAGGHLAALMGTSSGHMDWEPKGSDCKIQAIVDYFGPTSMQKEWAYAAEPGSPVELMLDESISTPRGKSKAAFADPITYIDGSEPPFLIRHGDSDRIVPYKQSTYLRDALEAAGVSVALHRVYGGDHGFYSETANKVADDFLDYHLKNKKIK